MPSPPRAQVEETEAVLKRMEDPEAMFVPARDKLVEALEAMEAVLAPQYTNASAYMCGVEYSLADVVATCLLARACWTDEGRAAVSQRRCLSLYWDRVRARDSFFRADVWESARPGRVFCVVGSLLQRASRALGGFLHERVVTPVQQTEAYAWAAPFLVDHYNAASVLTVEDITLPAVHYVDDNVVKPSVDASITLYDASRDGMAGAVGPLGEGAGDGAKAAAEAAAKAASDTREAAEKVGREALAAADKAVGPAKEVVMEKVIPGMADHGERIAEYTDKARPSYVHLAGSLSTRVPCACALLSRTSRQHYKCSVAQPRRTTRPDLLLTALDGHVCATGGKLLQ